MQDTAASGACSAKTFSSAIRSWCSSASSSRARWHIDRFHGAAQVSQLLGLHQPVISLHFSQRHPQLAPQAALMRFAPQAAHGG